MGNAGLHQKLIGKNVCFNKLPDKATWFKARNIWWTIWIKTGTRWNTPVYADKINQSYLYNGRERGERGGGRDLRQSTR